MKILLFALPATMLVVSFIACNDKAYKKMSSADAATVDHLDRKADQLDRKMAPQPDAFKSEAFAADSSALVANAREDQQSDQKIGEAGQIKTAGKDPSPARTPQSNPDWDKKIVKTANLSVEVRNFKSYNALLYATVRRFGAYIAQESQTQSASRIENTMTIKVPVEQFDETMNQLSSVADSDKLLKKEISSEDVTMEVVDTKSRMGSKREVLQRYQDLLKQARNMNEIIKIQNEIDEIQEQIEGAQGRVGYLSHSAAFSTINLNFYQLLDGGAITTTDPEPSFLHKIKLAFAAGWDWVSSLVLGLISVWPLGLALLFGWLGIRKWKGTMRAKPIAP